MGKIIDFLFAKDWKEYQEIRLMKKIGKAVEKFSEDELKGMSKEDLIRLIKEAKKKEK